MTSFPRKWWLASIVLAGSIGAGMVLRADDKPASDDSKPEVKAEVRVIAIAAPGKHWIGIHATPINDDALKSQLNLEKDRLIVVKVMPDSPSAKAGVQQHDILIKFGDQEVSNLDDLVKAVNDNGDKDVKLLVLRAGKSTTLAIHPAERPADGEITVTTPKALPQNLRAFIEEAHKNADGKGDYTLRMFGPGIAGGKAFAFSHAGNADFPNGLSLSVTKENDQPAKIVAKKDGKTYETTEDKLGELPADIRQHVERLLSKPQAMAFSLGDLKKFDVDSGKVQIEVQKAVEAAKKQAEAFRERHEAEEKGVRRTEVRRIEGGPLEELRKEIEALRKEVQKLKNDDKDDS